MSTIEDRAIEAKAVGALRARFRVPCFGLARRDTRKPGGSGTARSIDARHSSRVAQVRTTSLRPSVSPGSGICSSRSAGEGTRWPDTPSVTGGS